MGRRKSKRNVHYFSSRQRKISDLVDRISILPDCILSVILSFLPTEEAVASSVLSKRWKFTWVTVHSLDFDFYYYGFGKAHEKGADMKFIEFVKNVLHLHTCGLLNKFRLVWNADLISSSLSNSWINTAITKNVCELSLQLTSGITFVYDEIVICLPRLKSLKISRVSFESTKACETLVSGCPLLNYLHLNICNDDFECIISSESLRRLEISFEGKCSLKLKASSLEYLMLHGCISDIFVDKCLASLVQVDFNIELDEFDFPTNSIVEGVRAFDCAKVLTLSFDAIRALSHATINLSTKFKRLVKLVAGSCSSLQDFIHSSENLEVLIIHQDPDESNFNDHSKWSSLGEVPRCLSNSLKKVQLDNYTGSKDERKMIRFMLKHGSVLEVMKISCNGDEESDDECDEESDYESYEERYRDLKKKFELLQKICKFPRKSPACEVCFF